MAGVRSGDGGPDQDDPAARRDMLLRSRGLAPDAEEATQDPADPDTAAVDDPRGAATEGAAEGDAAEDTDEGPADGEDTADEG